MRDGVRSMVGIVSGAMGMSGLNHLSMSSMRLMLAFRKEKVKKVSQAREEKDRKGARLRAPRDKRASSGATQNVAEDTHPISTLNLALCRTVDSMLTLPIVTVIPVISAACLRDT